MKGRSQSEEIGRLARPEQVVTDVDNELDFHLEGRIEELVADGWSRSDAQAEAMRQFGDLARYREECRAIARNRAVAGRRFRRSGGRTPRMIGTGGIRPSGGQRPPPRPCGVVRR